MKKGFTLIEVLIIMIIVSVLVAVALPKYQRALERGRALEGLSNVRMLADYFNAKYLVYATNGDVYSQEQAAADLAIMKHNLIKDKFFINPSVAVNGSAITVSVQRDTRTGWSYSLVASSTNGDINSIVCTTGVDDACAKLDLNENLVERK